MLPKASPATFTLPLTVTVPAVPPAPNAAMFPEDQATFVVPSHQFVPEADVLQVPPPSCGPDDAGVASQVNCDWASAWPLATARKTRADATDKTRLAPLTAFFLLPG